MLSHLNIHFGKYFIGLCLAVLLLLLIGPTTRSVVLSYVHTTGRAVPEHWDQFLRGLGLNL
jgi:hypothetical protein